MCYRSGQRGETRHSEDRQRRTTADRETRHARMSEETLREATRQPGYAKPRKDPLMISRPCLLMLRVLRERKAGDHAPLVVGLAQAPEPFAPPHCPQREKPTRYVRVGASSEEASTREGSPQLHSGVKGEFVLSLLLNLSFLPQSLPLLLLEETILLHELVGWG